jgi:hypothetical protein
MPLHDTWTVDGRRLDLMCRDEQGVLGRKGRRGRLYFYAVMEMRSRYLIGYAFGFDLNTDLVRAALLKAIDTTRRVVPREIQADNGMEFAAKEISGGAPWRRRGKVKAEEVTGTVPLFGIGISWATPAHGQAKPVERLFKTLAAVETRPEFRGGYLGNNPVNRPEECDSQKDVPVAAVMRAYAEEIQDYHQRGHRGEGMNGRAPLAIYTELMHAPGFVPREISPEQRRLAALQAMNVTLSRHDGAFAIYDIRYWSEETAMLPSGRYTVRFNPNDLTEPVTLYHANGKIAAGGVKPRTVIHGNHDKAAAKEIKKNRAAFKRKVKEVADATRGALGAIAHQSII